MKDARFQGKVWAGARNADGTPGPLSWLGDVPQLQIKMNVEKDERQENFSGQSLTSVSSVKAKKAELSMTLNYFSKNNLALALFATAIDVASGTVTGEALPIDVVAGDTIALDHRDVSAVSLTGADGTTPLVLGTDYSEESLPGGLITVKDPTNFTNGTGTPQAAATADYSYAATTRLPMFTSAVPERYLVLDGINVITNERVRLRIFRAQFDPVSQLDTITDALTELQLSGTVLYDEVNAADANLGGFGRIELPQAA